MCENTARKFIGFAQFIWASAAFSMEAINNDLSSGFVSSI